MTHSDIAKSVEAARGSDELIDQALDEREQRYGHPVFEHHHLRRMRVSHLAERYRDGGVFPSARTPGVVARAIDVKLQTYVTGEIIPGLVNEHYYARVNSSPALAEMASIKLLLVSLHQDTITKSRILWDRIMGWVYFIETGKRTSRGQGAGQRSERSSRCAATPRWRWMVAYEQPLTDFDNRFRTPEVHKRSMLRALLMRGAEPDELGNELMSLLNHGLNQIWDNVESIVGGGGVVSLGSAHMPAEEDGNVNPFDRWGWQP